MVRPQTVSTSGKQLYITAKHQRHLTLIFSCVQAEPSVNASARDASCIFYKYTAKDGICKNIITSLYVFGNLSTLDYGERETSIFKIYFTFLGISNQCQRIIRDLVCRYQFQPCDTTLQRPRPRRICRRTCEYLIHVLCVKDMTDIRKAAAQTAHVIDYDMINCSTYDVANGGDAPECYQYHPLSGLYTAISIFSCCLTGSKRGPLLYPYSLSVLSRNLQCFSMLTFLETVVVLRDIV